jgi:hypothetical protein
MKTRHLPVATAADYGPVEWDLYIGATRARAQIWGTVTSGGRGGPFDAHLFMTPRTAEVLTALEYAGSVSALMRWNRSTLTSVVRPYSDHFGIEADPEDLDEVVEAVAALLEDGDEAPARTFVERVQEEKVRAQVCEYMTLAFPERPDQRVRA